MILSDGAHHLESIMSQAGPLCLGGWNFRSPPKTDETWDFSAALNYCFKNLLWMKPQRPCVDTDDRDSPTWLVALPFHPVCSSIFSPGSSFASRMILKWDIRDTLKWTLHPLQSPYFLYLHWFSLAISFPLDSFVVMIMIVTLMLAVVMIISNILWALLNTRQCVCIISSDAYSLWDGGCQSLISYHRCHWDLERLDDSSISVIITVE